MDSKLTLIVQIYSFGIASSNLAAWKAQRFYTQHTCRYLTIAKLFSFYTERLKCFYSFPLITCHIKCYRNITQ